MEVFLPAWATLMCNKMVQDPAWDIGIIYRHLQQLWAIMGSGREIPCSDTKATHWYSHVEWRMFSQGEPSLAFCLSSTPMGRGWENPLLLGPAHRKDGRAEKA